MRVEEFILTASAMLASAKLRTEREEYVNTVLLNKLSYAPVYSPLAYDMLYEFLRLAHEAYYHEQLSEEYRDILGEILELARELEL